VGRQQQHEHSAVPGLQIERAESSIKPAEMGVNRDIQYSKNQREALEFWKDKIADRPAGASGDSNNTRF
jgi:hypothetical protein